MAAPAATSIHPTSRFRRVRALGALGALVLAGAGAAPAATFTVLNINDSGPGSLRQAILDANGNSGPDTINFAPVAAGTILLSSLLPAVVEDLDIAGPGSAVLTVSGNHALPVFHFNHGVTATISDLAISDGVAPSEGAAIFNVGTLTIRGCVLSGNSASFGGAISNQGGSISNQGTLTIVDTTLTGNHANISGGGISNAGILTINSSTLSGNSADAFGGGIANLGGFGFSGGRLTINDSTLSGNSGGDPNFNSGGGGIGNAGEATINHSTLVGNTAIAGSGGGGIENLGFLTINNSTLSGNSTQGSGGGVWNRRLVVIDGGIATISYSTLASNTAASGGGLFNEVSDSTVVIKSSLAASNVGGDCANPGGGSFTALGANLATDGSCPGFTQVSPALLRLGPLAANGGPTQTHALLSGSVAIDAALDCTDAAGNTVAEDQRGEVRPVNGAGIAACDVGAFEFSTSLSIPILSDWGLRLLALLLAGVAVLLLRGRKLGYLVG